MNAIILAAEEGAHHANTFLLPGDINEVIWGSISFLLIAGLLYWKGGPAIKGMWNGRIERIANELDTAESARREAEAKLSAVESDIADADTERARILAEARETADTVKAQIIERAATDAADLRARGAADVEAAKAQAASDLQAEIGVLALGAAEAVVANNLDDATQNELIENYINRVGAGS
jgi:F-type H+-transporting ATPase subunit b